MRLLTYQETASYLKLSLSTVYNLICQGRLPYASPPSGGKRIVKEELDRMLEEKVFIPRPRLRIARGDVRSKGKVNGVLE